MFTRTFGLFEVFLFRNDPLRFSFESEVSSFSLGQLTAQPSSSTVGETSGVWTILFVWVYNQIWLVTYTTRRDSLQDLFGVTKRRTRRYGYTVPVYLKLTKGPKEGRPDL